MEIYSDGDSDEEDPKKKKLIQKLNQKSDKIANEGPLNSDISENDDDDD